MATKRKYGSSGTSFSDDKLEEFIKNGFALFPYDGIPVRQICGYGVERYTMFLEQSEEHLNKFKLNIPREGSPFADDGYIRKGMGETEEEKFARKDKKEVFQYRSDYLGHLSVRGIYPNARDSRFFSECEKIRRFAMRVELELAQGLDRILRGHRIYRALTNKTAMELHVLRLLSYYPPKDLSRRNTLAAYHYDRSCFTIHLWESHPGLYLGEKGKEVPYVSRDDRILIFAGDKAQILTGGHASKRAYERSGEKIIRGGAIPRLRHGVLPNQKQRGRRQSIVFFGHTKHQLPWK